MTSFLGIDVGTSSLRVVLLDEDGLVIASNSAPYETLRDAGGVVEQDPRSWSTALERALADTPEIRRAPPVAIGLCGQTPTVVPIDATGAPTRNALTWQDTRSAREARELAEHFGDPRPHVGTELPWSAANMPAKLLWLSRHEPDTVRQSASILQPKDFIGNHLTGVASSDPWSSKGLCDVNAGEPLSDILDYCGWPTRICPDTSPPWSSRGEVTSAASELFGLPAGIPVSVGASDAIAEMIAAGCFANASGFFFSGTSSIVGTTVQSSSARVGGLFNVPATCAPLPLLYGPTNSGGSVLSWAAAILNCDVDELLSLAMSSAATPPTFVPYLSGERAPVWNQDVRALLVGVDESQGRAELAKSFVSGVFLAALDILASVEEATGSPLNGVEVVSRGVQNSNWESLAIESLGLPLRFHDDADMSARGSAMLACAVRGTDIVEASRQLGAAYRPVHPAPADVIAARRRLEDYRSARSYSLHWGDRAEHSR